MDFSYNKFCWGFDPQGKPKLISLFLNYINDFILDKTCNSSEFNIPVLACTCLLYTWVIWGHLIRLLTMLRNQDVLCGLVIVITIHVHAI